MMTWGDDTFAAFSHRDDNVMIFVCFCALSVVCWILFACHSEESSSSLFNHCKWES